MKKKDPDRELKTEITELFSTEKERFGYRRITDKLRANGYLINHKKVQRIMQELGLKCVKFSRKSRRYNSYKGKMGKGAKNRLNRHFHTTIPLQKLVTDVTEFKCIGEKRLYLSPILDLFNKEILAFNISDSPTVNFVLRPLEEAIKLVKDQATFRTTIHSDQGFQYRNKKWHAMLKQNNIFQSMSRKGNCADNAAMESFFGILKQEMYHGEPLKSYEELKQKIEDYLYYYNHDRIKTGLGGLSPIQYRTQRVHSIAA